MRIHRESLLELYDPRQADGGFATAVSALGGEELGIRLLQQYLIANGRKAERLPGIPKTGKRSGFRLDGWLIVDNQLMQIEVKNWGANALGGKEYREYDGNQKAGWDQFVAWWKDPGLRKVLSPMQPPPNYPTIQHAVACMWPVMNPYGENEPWFSVPIDALSPLGFETSFDRLHVFSMSGYLHSLDDEWLEIPMPVLENRMRRLVSIFAE